MNFVYDLLAVAFTIVFFILLFLFAWYVALPLLIIGLFVGVILSLFNRRKHRTVFIKREKKNPDVIDVEWTEM